MNTRWQTALIAALVLPVGGFVAGSIVSSADDEPATREEIVVRAPVGTSSASPSGEPTSFEFVPPSDDMYDYYDDDHSGQGDGGGSSGGGGDDGH